MSRSWLMVVAAVALGTSCSHEQKLEATATPTKAASPAPRKAAVAEAPVSEPQEVPRSKEKEAVFFDFDSALVKADAHPVLQEVAGDVRKRNASLQIEGNCDELGTVEYNLALGEHRARAAKDYLVHLGVPANRIATVSYGSQRPKYPGHSDDDRARNRRDDLVVR